jgi:hypothetical protein
VAKKQPAAKPISREGGSEAQPTRYIFRGRIIEVDHPGEYRLQLVQRHGRIEGVVKIDGREVMYEQTAEGVHTHEYMFRRFSTPEELAEALVQDWGTSTPSPESMPPHEHATDDSVGSAGHRKGHHH